MPQDLFSSPPGDDEEPGSSPLPPAAEEEDDPGFTGQGLYVSLPPEHLSLIEGCDERPRVAQDHADAAPLASSRSG